MLCLCSNNHGKTIRCHNPLWPADGRPFNFSLYLQRRRREDQSKATDRNDFLFLALEKTHGRRWVNVGPAKMMNILKRCQRLVTPVFTGTVSAGQRNALTLPAPISSRHSPTLRRNFAVNISPCHRRYLVHSSLRATTRSYSEEWRERGDADRDAAAVADETDIDRRRDKQGSAMA